MVLYAYWCESAKEQVFVSIAVKAPSEGPDTDLYPGTIRSG